MSANRQIHEETIAMVRLIVNVVQARLEDVPADAEAWDAIAFQLAQAARIARKVATPRKSPETIRHSASGPCYCDACTIANPTLPRRTGGK